MVGIISFILFLLFLSPILSDKAPLGALILASMLAGFLSILSIQEKDLYRVDQYGNKFYDRGDVTGTYHGFFTGIVITILYFLFTGTSLYVFWFQPVVYETFNGVVYAWIGSLAFSFLICSMAGLVGGLIGGVLRKYI